MIVRYLFGCTGQTVAITTAIVGGLVLAVMSEPAHAISTGEAIGMEVGTVGVGAATGFSAAPAPRYYAPPAYAQPAQPYAQPVQTHVPPATTYGPALNGSCGHAGDGRYYPC
jgi:hypothetical protein